MIPGRQPAGASTHAEMSVTSASIRCTVSRCSATIPASCEKIWPSSAMVDSMDSMAVERDWMYESCKSARRRRARRPGGGPAGKGQGLNQPGMTAADCRGSRKAVQSRMTIRGELNPPAARPTASARNPLRRPSRHSQPVHQCPAPRSPHRHSYPAAHGLCPSLRRTRGSRSLVRHWFVGRKGGSLMSAGRAEGILAERESGSISNAGTGGRGQRMTHSLRGLGRRSRWCA